MPIRILQVFASLDRGGAETMMMNIYRKIDREKIQFDFVVNANDSEYAYENEITQLGGRVYRMPRYLLYNYFSYRQAWRRLLLQHPEWQIIHGHHTAAASVYLGVARAMSRKTIAHSHVAGRDNTLKSYAKMAVRYPLRFKTDYLFACSFKAAWWMFGKHSRRAHVIKNAIDARRFAHNEKTACDKFVVGHVGRFELQKNHAFLVDIFAEVKRLRPEAVLLLVGDGKLRCEIESKVRTDGVYFLGVREDIPELLRSMDVLVFPSLYEGLPVTVIEAQAAGLPCVISDAITDEVIITDLVKQFPLNASAHKWAEAILDFADTVSRRDTYDEIVAAGYDIGGQAEVLSKFYLNL